MTTFEPKHLADAIEIGPSLRLVDKLNPGMATGPSGNFCLLMSLRFTEEPASGDVAREIPTPAITARISDCREAIRPPG